MTEGAKMDRGSPQRFEVLGGPGGQMTCLAVGDARRWDRYRRFVTLARINRPLTPELSSAAKGWVLRRCELVNG